MTTIHEPKHCPECGAPLPAPRPDPAELARSLAARIAEYRAHNDELERRIAARDAREGRR
jgi:uncharacterized protein YbbK (DUF523 family)